ncbi:MAG TPA: acyl-CoA dehydrogenase, partial [Acidimicrobiales bacterium]|nr:acyl-CoA dehydrogenase [Acidimicrobiales bacterium]
PFAGSVLALGELDDALGRGAIAEDDMLGESTVGAMRRALAEGEAVGAIAWSRRADAVTAGAGGRASGAPWQLTGRPDPVVDGPVADVLVVLGRDAEGPALFATATEAASRAPGEPAMDRTRAMSWTTFADAPALRLGGGESVEALVDRGATLVCAEMLGAAARVLDMTVEYAKDRVQFDRPIGSFQAVKHRCADMLVDVEGMRSTTYYAAWAVGADDAEARAAASAAKIWCSDASARVMGSGLQVHGGIGFTWEHDLHLYLKRAQLDRVRFGDATFHRERLAAILRPKAEKGEPVL